MARVAWNWYSGMVLVLEDNEAQTLLQSVNSIDSALDQILEPVLKAAKVIAWKAYLIKAIVKGIFLFRRWNIQAANRRRRGLYVTFSWLMFASLFIPTPITGPLPAVIINATFNPLFVFIGPR
ncbi:MAG: hypothetical protein JNL17_07465 [Cyclobacteriaceae bacterium]|nr:hypothetical protein [Cyclobacteriaceae bacterium]